MGEAFESFLEFAANHGPITGLIFGLLCLLGLFPTAGRRRMLASMPLCKAKGVFIGLVQIEGEARADQPIRSYLAESDCVMYRYNISEHWRRTRVETYTDSNGRTQTRTVTETGWETVASGEAQIIFELHDDTGLIQVDPAGCSFDGINVFNHYCTMGDPLYHGKGPTRAVSGSTGRRHFTEYAIPIGDHIYIAATAREREDIAELQLAKGESDPFFIVDTDGQKDVLKNLRWASIAWFVGALALIGIGVFAAHSVEAPRSQWIAETSLAFGLFGLFWLLGSLVHVRNQFVGIRERVNQASSLVDVHLTRRYDLIPQLVEVAKESARYESSTHSDLAELRSVPNAANALAEKYPDLKASANFAKLQAELSDTEDRIALSRGYYISAVNLYRTMLETFPDGGIARLLGHRVPEKHEDV